MKHHFTRSKKYSEKKGCPPGFHKRTAYVSSRGHRVPPRCVRSTTVYENTSKEFKRKMVGRMTQRLGGIHIPSIKSLTRKACPPGQIERKAYVRKYSTAVRQRGFTVRRKSGASYRVFPKAQSTVVESKCVKDLGKPGKGPQAIGPLRKGELKRYGYSLFGNEADRRAALRRAIARYGTLGVYRKLNAVSKLVHTTAPAASKIYEKDRNWIQNTFGLKAFSD